MCVAERRSFGSDQVASDKMLLSSVSEEREREKEPSAMVRPRKRGSYPTIAVTAAAALFVLQKPLWLCVAVVVALGRQEASTR